MFFKSSFDIKQYPFLCFFVFTSLQLYLHEQGLDRAGIFLSSGRETPWLGLAVLGVHLDLVIILVFFNLNDSMILISLSNFSLGFHCTVLFIMLLKQHQGLSKQDLNCAQDT